MLGGEIDQKAFRDDEHVLRQPAQLREELLPLRAIREIESHAAQRDPRRFSRQDSFLVGEDLGKIHLHPLEGAREIHPVGSRVQPRREIDHQVSALPHVFRDEGIEEVGPDRERPTLGRSRLDRGGDLLASSPREPPRERVPEHRVGPLRLPRPVHRDPPRRVGDVADEGGGVSHERWRIDPEAGWNKGLVHGRDAGLEGLASTLLFCRLDSRLAAPKNPNPVPVFSSPSRCGMLARRPT